MLRQTCQATSSELLSFLYVRRDPLMAILNFYCDESGKFEDKTVITFCGLCASRSALEKFEDRWGEQLRRNGLPWLTMKEALQADRTLGLIPAQTSRERIEALKPFAACLVETFELGVVVSVNVEAFGHTAQKFRRETSGATTQACSRL